MNLIGIGFEHGHQIGMLKSLSALEDVALTAIADTNPETLAKGKESFPDVPAYEDPIRALDEHKPGMVALTSRNHEKADYIEACAQRGTHVFADKPLCTTWEQQSRIEQTVAQTGIRLSICYSLRDHAAWRKTHDLIQEGAVGEFVYMIMSMPHCLRPPTRSEAMLRAKWNGGLVVDLGSHPIDCLRWFSGREISAITAVHGRKRFTDQEDFQDYGQISARLDDGATGMIGLDWLQPDGGGYNVTLQIMGTEGAIRLAEPNRLTLSSVPGEPKEMEVVDAFRPEVTIYEDFRRACLDADHRPALSTEDVLESSRWLLRARDAAESDPPKWVMA